MYCIRFVMIYNNYRVRGVSMRMKSKYLKRWNLPGVRQLKIHKSSKSGLVAAFFVSSP